MNSRSLLSLLVGFLLLTSSCFLTKNTSKNAPEPIPEEKPEQPKEEQPVTEKEEEKSDKEEKVLRIALLLPLDIDGVTSSHDFDVSGEDKLPSATLNGLEFYEGALMAIDSLRKRAIPVELHVHDTRAVRKPIKRLLSGRALDTADVIIGAIKGDEFKEVSHFAEQKKIPFISATYPNDGGIKDNPYVVIVNSTLRVHAIALQAFAQQKFSNKKINVIYYDNAQGKKNLEYIQEAYTRLNTAGKTQPQPFEWTDSTTADDLIPQLDKSKTNVLLLTTLYPDISLDIIKELMPLVEDYKINIVGMPTLESLHELKGPQFKGVNLYYGSVFPYSNLEKNEAMKNVLWRYFDYYNASPSKEALSGYETVFYFGNLINKQDKSLEKHLNDIHARLLTEFNFQPVYLSGANQPDYYENTRIYFIKIRDGVVTPAN